MYIESYFQIVFNRNKLKEKVFGILICVTKCISIFCFYKQNSKDGTATIYNEDGRFQYNISDVSNQKSELGGLFFFFFWQFGDRMTYNKCFKVT